MLSEPIAQKAYKIMAKVQIGVKIENNSWTKVLPPEFDPQT
jgi:hypothetical protein